MLARVVGRRRRRVAAVVRREDQQVALGSASRRSGRRRSKSWRQRWKLTGSLRWPQSDVRLDEVREDEPVVECRSSPSVIWIPSTFDLVGIDSSMSQRAKMSRSFRRRAPCGRHRDARVVRPRRLEREVVPVRRPHVVPGSPTNGRAMTRPTACLPVRISRATRQPRRAPPAAPSPRVRRSGTPSRRTCRRSTSRFLVLLAELLDDIGPPRRLVPEHAAPGLVHERVDHWSGWRADRSASPSA